MVSSPVRILDWREDGVGDIAGRCGAAPRASPAELVEGVNRAKVGTAIAPVAKLPDRKMLDAATGRIDFVAT